MSDDFNTKSSQVSQGMEFLLQNELMSDIVVNDLIMAGFLVHKKIQDVQIFVDQTKRLISYHLFFPCWYLWWVNKKLLKDKLRYFVTSGLKNYEVDVKCLRYVKKKDEVDYLESPNVV